MFIDLLQDPHEIHRICIMGRNCTLLKLSDDVERFVPSEKHIAEVFMLLKETSEGT